MKCRLIEDDREVWPVRVMCDARGVSSAGFWAWRSPPESPRTIAHRALLADMRRVHADHRGRYRAPRLPAALCAQGQSVNRQRVARMMRRHSIRAHTPRRDRVCTTDSKHSRPVAANLLAQNGAAAKPDRIWVADMTPACAGAGSASRAAKAGCPWP
jgi:putative transposase